MRTFEAENGRRITAINDTQAEAFIGCGLEEVFEEPEDLFPDLSLAKEAPPVEKRKR